MLAHAPTRSSTLSSEQRELRLRMQKPQRHRLLHAYPLAAAMPAIPDSIRAGDNHFRFSLHSGRGLLIGVLPHPFCNPKIRGCGFCTFPHEQYGNLQAAAVVGHVIKEIQHRLDREPSLQRRKVLGLYLGGGTANLTPAEPFRRLCRQLNAAFDLSEAEVTLEGAPVYFIKRQPLLIDIMREEIGARHFRISMGIQTFDERRLEDMGRLAFGTRAVIQEVVHEAHRRGLTVSGDLLFNLPWQRLDEMQSDVRLAAEIGLDHVGLYHLVVFRGLGTEWSKDSSLLAGLPANDVAAEYWESLREELHAHRFTQTTLTNFERESFAGRANRYQYEELSFLSDRCEMLGFGPSGISFAADAEFKTGWKTMNPVSSTEYMQSVSAPGLTARQYFQYAPRDLRIFDLTRRLAGLAIDPAAYRRRFDSELRKDFRPELNALLAEGLLEESQRMIHPTIRGMFYADSIASMFARRRLSDIGSRSRPPEELGPAIVPSGRVNDNGSGYM